MGMIYKARLLDKIDNDTMLRLCFIVNKSFFLDLKKLPDYVEDKTQDTIAAYNFINLGLIDNFVGGYWKDEPSWVLNQTGRILHDILKSNGWFD